MAHNHVHLQHHHAYHTLHPINLLITNPSSRHTPIYTSNATTHTIHYTQSSYSRTFPAKRTPSGLTSLTGVSSNSSALPVHRRRWVVRSFATSL